jgi:hypothetical protein
MLALLMTTACGGFRPCAAPQIDQVCVPQQVASNAPLQLEAGNACGSGCYPDKRPACEVTVNGAQLQLKLTANWCVDSLQACPSACARWTVACQVPALAAGDYTVTVNGGHGHTLAVRAGAATTTCTLP